MRGPPIRRPSAYPARAIGLHHFGLVPGRLPRDGPGVCRRVERGLRRLPLLQRPARRLVRHHEGTEAAAPHQRNLLLPHLAYRPDFAGIAMPLDQQPPAGGQPPGQPSQSPANNQAAVPAVPPASSSAPARASDANLIAWGWPAQGSVVQKFNPPKNRGIDISGNAGDPVYAAADGKVKYAGNGIPGLGNLVIIEHSNGFMTAYAHNQTLLVKCNQVGQDKGCPNVKRGAKIATLGETDAATPMLHFEIRKQGDPVDPLQYLPAR